MSEYLMTMLDGKLQHVDAESGELVELSGDEEISFDDRSSKRIWKRWADTETGSRFYEHYYSNPENQEVLISVFKKLYSDECLTVSRLADSFETALLSGSFVEPKTVEPTAPVARDQQGRFANRLLAEYHQMLDDRSIPAFAITQRMQKDRAFREAIASESQVKPQRQRGVIPSQEEIATLRDFATSYRTAKSLRPLQGRITLSSAESYSVAEFNELVERACQFGLL